MKLHSFNQQFDTAILNAKKIGKVPEDWNSQLEEFLKQLDCINSLSRRAKRYGNTPTDEIIIPDSFKKFVAPSSVTDTGNDEDEDWLKRDSDVSVDEMWTDVEFYDFYSMFKLITGKDAAVKLSDVRDGAQITNDSRLGFSYDGKACAGNSVKTVPWELSRRVCVDYCYSEDVNTVMKRVIQRFMD